MCSVHSCALQAFVLCGNGKHEAVAQLIPNKQSWYMCWLSTEMCFGLGVLLFCCFVPGTNIDFYA